MIQKLTLVVIASFCILVLNPVFGDDINFNKCANNPDHHCMEYIPEENTMNQTNPNYSLIIHLPTWGNTDNSVVFVISNENYTHLQNNVGVISVNDIHTTNERVNSNYCPIAKLVLQNQGSPEYIDRFYNKTSGKDLTGLIYPIYCHIETGPNTINGDGSIPAIPEFPQSLGIIIGISIMIGIVFTIKRDLKHV